MSYEQHFVLTSSLDADKLQQEIRSILSTDGAKDAGKATPDDYIVRQKAGTGIEAVLIVFASKVAYDVWRELILPRLKAKYGGAAATPTAEAVEK